MPEKPELSTQAAPGELDPGQTSSVSPSSHAELPASQLPTELYPQTTEPVPQTHELQGHFRQGDAEGPSTFPRSPAMPNLEASPPPDFVPASPSTARQYEDEIARLEEAERRIDAEIQEAERLRALREQKATLQERL